MNIFSNIGVTELVLILLLALIVVGPERLPEIGQKIGKTLRDVRKAYDNLAKDIGPELASLQKTTQELRQSVQAVQSIPQDAVKTLVKAADLEDTVSEISGMASTVTDVGKTLSSTGKMLQSPVSAAVGTAQSTLLGKKPEQAEAEHGQEPTVAEVLGESQGSAQPEPEQEPSVVAVLGQATPAGGPARQGSLGEETIEGETAEAVRDSDSHAGMGEDASND